MLHTLAVLAVPVILFGHEWRIRRLTDKTQDALNVLNDELEDTRRRVAALEAHKAATRA